MRDAVLLDISYHPLSHSTVKLTELAFGRCAVVATDNDAMEALQWGFA
jgi:hypothetical protein